MTIKKGQNIGLESCSFYIIDGVRIAIAEISMIEKSLVHSYLDDAFKKRNANKKLIEQTRTLLNQSEKIYFFNRLNVPEPIQNKGYGKELMQQLTTFIQDNQAFLLNTASAYGSLTQKKLVHFYQNAGLALLDKGGLMVFHQDIHKEIPTKSLAKSSSPKI